MDAKQKKRFFTNHSKSSAMVVSLTLHAILLVVALSFVAVKVVTKDDKKFESKQVNRPRLPPKKLQVPVKIKKQKRKPKLRQRIVVKPTVNRNMPDIKMPEITGIKGGLGAAGGAGLGNAGSVGFSMPEIDVFGVKSRGEKVFIALDSDGFMMRDEVGGLPAYTIIKEELTKIIEGLGPTTLFNLAVFDHHSTTILFPRMVPATRENTSRVGKWLEPLNKVEAGMSDDAYGTKTLGSGGTTSREDFAGGELHPVEWPNSARHWYSPSALAMQQQADTVFVLTGWWGVMRYAKSEWKVWPDAKRRRWEEHVRKGEQMLADENKERRANGEAPRVIRDHHMLIREYFPAKYESLRQPEPEWYRYTARDFAKSLHLFRKEQTPRLPSKSGLTKKKKDTFSLNVIFFARVDDLDAQAWEIEQFNEMASLCKGKFRSIAGLEAIQSSVSGR